LDNMSINPLVKNIDNIWQKIAFLSRDDCGDYTKVQNIATNVIGVIEAVFSSLTYSND